MSLAVTDLKLPITADESSLANVAARALGISERDVLSLHIKRISLDARKKDDLFFLYTVEISLTREQEAFLLKRQLKNVFLAEGEVPREIRIGKRKLEQPVVVVGLGPAGLFAAYMLAKYGYHPIAIERGKPVEERRLDVERFWKEGNLLPQSNVMFGEGGAGTFSDGKLTTRIKDARAREVVELLVEFGAPQRIKLLAKPHIGTDHLINTVGNMRRAVENLGGSVLFETKLTGLQKDADGNLTAVQIVRNGNAQKLECCACVLAIGQGARDTYRMLHKAGLELRPKAFAVGVRIEHPRELIDRSQFGKFAGHPRLGAAEYRLAGRSGDRGVYTFCMCPGGSVVASSSDMEQVVTNGMSNYARDGANSNAAIVVQVDPRDFGENPLSGMLFQEKLERDAYLLGGSTFEAPAERVGDFLKRLAPKAFGDVSPTYRPGVVKRDLFGCLPEFVAMGIRDGISTFGRKLKGFDFYDAVLTAVESRTSSPVRIERDETTEATRMHGLYPVGEGAGYAGGIVSAAVDGMRAAQCIIETYKPV